MVEYAPLLVFCFVRYQTRFYLTGLGGILSKKQQKYPDEWTSQKSIGPSLNIWCSMNPIMVVLMRSGMPI